FHRRFDNSCCDLCLARNSGPAARPHSGHSSRGIDLVLPFRHCACRRTPVTRTPPRSGFLVLVIGVVWTAVLTAFRIVYFAQEPLGNSDAVTYAQAAGPNSETSYRYYSQVMNHHRRLGADAGRALVATSGARRCARPARHGA